MVQSKLKEELNYLDMRHIDKEDLRHSSSIYIIQLFDKNIPIALGKPKYQYRSNFKIIYFPIYIVTKNKKKPIGLFEINDENTLDYLDEDNDIDITKMDEPLLFSFVTTKFIEKNTSPENTAKLIAEYDEIPESGSSPENDEKSESINKTKKELLLSTEDTDADEDDASDALTLKVSSARLSKQKKIAEYGLKDGVFEEIYTKTGFIYREEKLKEETEEDADALKFEYKESSHNTWIECFMKNNNYDVSTTAENADSFFYCIVDAFLTIGKKTTVTKLRSILSLQCNEMFDKDISFKEQFEDRIQQIENQLKELKRVNKIYSKRLNSIANMADKKEMIAELKKLGVSFENKKKNLKEFIHLKENEIGYMKDIHSLETYREFVLSSKYYPDTWALSILEKQLNTKFIILSQDSYTEKIFNSVLKTNTTNTTNTAKNDDAISVIECNESSHSSSKEHKKQFNPDYYIMLSVSKDKNYKLISYKKKKIFTFSEIPYDIKILILNKCLEKNSGIYYLIQDFRHFKSLFGLDPDEGNPTNDDDNGDETNLIDEYGHSYIKKYDLSPNIVFLISNKCLHSKAGEGSGESIPLDKRIDFVKLSARKNWRCHLDDMTTQYPMTIDNRRWASVEHYIQACKFKKGFPEFYRAFSLDDNNSTEMSKNAEVAKQVADLKKHKYKDLRPEGVKIDIDYNLGRQEEEREKAVRAKFTQNIDLKEILLMTYPAILKHVERRKPPTTDNILMKIRKELT